MSERYDAGIDANGRQGRDDLVGKLPCEQLDDQDPAVVVLWLQLQAGLHVLTVAGQYLLDSRPNLRAFTGMYRNYFMIKYHSLIYSLTRLIHPSLSLSCVSGFSFLRY